MCERPDDWQSSGKLKKNPKTLYARKDRQWPVGRLTSTVYASRRMLTCTACRLRGVISAGEAGRWTDSLALNTQQSTWPISSLATNTSASHQRSISTECSERSSVRPSVCHGSSSSSSGRGYGRRDCWAISTRSQLQSRPQHITSHGATMPRCWRCHYARPHRAPVCDSHYTTTAWSLIATRCGLRTAVSQTRIRRPRTSDACAIHVSKVRSPVWARERCRISPPRFLAECCKRRLNQGSFLLLYFRLSTCIEFVYLQFPVGYCFVCQYQRSDWLWRPPPKWPILCRVGR